MKKEELAQLLAAARAAVVAYEHWREISAAKAPIAFRAEAHEDMLEALQVLELLLGEENP